MKISLSTARKLAVGCQGLDGRWKLPRGKEGAAQAIERLGYVQIDTIAVVQRAHEHTFWSRCADYTPRMLHELLAEDRRVFEGWTHAASYIPMCDYRYSLPRMRAFSESARTRRWMEQNTKVMKDVIDRIRKEGALGSADFEAPPGSRGPWWGWKPAKQALETLLSMGELMISERRNFQRIYDLRERVLPEGTDTTEPDGEAWGRFEVRRMLRGHGVATIGEVRGKGRSVIAEAVEEMVGSGEVTPVEIDGLGDEAYYALSALLEVASRRRRSRPRVHILSPFDSVVIRRRWLERLFGFDYKIECYVPAPKRKYGYFCLPILWGEQFVGRMDPKADRKQKVFIVRKLILEPDFKDYDGLLPALATKLQAFCAFNGCDRIVIDESVPRKVKGQLNRELKM